jgi:hypothetical protein
MQQQKTLFVFTLACAALLASSGSAQGIRPDEFNQFALDNSVWRFVDPRGSCTQNMSGSEARIAIPSGLSRDPVIASQGGFRVPRIVQQVADPVSGDVGDFRVFARFNGIENRQYHIQGITVYQDTTSFIRCEIYSADTRLYWLLFAIQNNVYASQHNSVILGSALGDAPLYLRLDRTGNTFTQYYAIGASTNWTLADTVQSTMRIDSMGVYAAVSDSIQLPRVPEIHAPAFTGLADYFRISDPLPIQLASLTATLQSNNLVRLNWTTITETNNYGFEIQKSLGGTQNFQTIQGSFIAGHGTTVEPRHYSYVDASTSPGNWYYRLKQIDLDGTINYTEPVHVQVLTGVDEKSQPAAFALDQNYPNPFNPSTEIRYQIAQGSHVTLKVYNVLGKEVRTLVNERLEKGSYTTSFDATGLTSGVYIYKLTAGAQTFTRKMTLLR